MPSTSCMNHAPASVAAAITAIASAAVSAGLAPPAACEGIVIMLVVTPDLLRGKRPSLQSARCRCRLDHRGVFCRFDDTGSAALCRQPLPLLARTDDAVAAVIAVLFGISRQARVDPPSPPAIFRRLRDLSA